jgi:hypothetical protein
VPETKNTKRLDCEFCSVTNTIAYYDNEKEINLIMMRVPFKDEQSNLFSKAKY